jgi:tryptophan synthase beta chain
VEAGGSGVRAGQNCATLELGKPGVLHGSYSYLLQSKTGQILPTHSISAGLDYPGVGPEHSYLKDVGRVKYVSMSDREALQGFKLLSELEGIIPALEPSHAIAYLKKLAPKLDKSQVVVVCLSGRGDKDVEEVKSKTKR